MAKIFSYAFKNSRAYVARFVRGIQKSGSVAGSRRQPLEQVVGAGRRQRSGLHLMAMTLILSTFSAQATPNETELAVWANEAIVSTYSYNVNNFLQRQKEIAKYFTAKGWTDYSAVFIASKIPEAVKTNSYFVSAVATYPPQIKALEPNKWQAKMPLLVVYQNPQYQQKQTLEVSINFIEVPNGQGVRGLAITSLQAKAITSTCKCDLTETTANEQEQPQDAK